MQRSVQVFSTVVWLVVVMILGCSSTAQAEFPDKPITLINGFAPGALTDMMARAISVGASKYLGQPIINETKTGGGGTVALGVLATVEPDGYTLCNVQNASIIDTSLIQKVTFKPLKSFVPIISYAMSEHSGLLVNKDAPWKTFKEFIDYAKQNPGKIKYGTTGVGTGMHVAMEVIAKRDGIKWVHMPYQGEPNMKAALLGKHVDAISIGVGFPPSVQSGDMRVLATHGKVRSPLFPTVPTLHELGYAFISETTHFIVAPAGLPADVLAKLEKAFTMGMETDVFKDTQTRFYLAPFYATGKEYELNLKERWTKMEKLFKELGIIKEAATQPY